MPSELAVKIAGLDRHIDETETALIDKLCEIYGAPNDPDRSEFFRTINAKIAALQELDPMIHALACMSWGRVSTAVIARSRGER